MSFFFFFFFFLMMRRPPRSTLFPTRRSSDPPSGDDEQSTIGLGGKCAVHDTEQVAVAPAERSEEHTSELQSRRDLVCRLLLEKKKKNSTSLHFSTKKNIEYRI